MACVFLSYDREDEPRARAVAAALERAGHSVWWDRQIKGGHEFSEEIEAELNAADKVVVLWSARAVKSAWVRDEAAVGRETGRLVPATLDGTPPPLGFRQLQTIDLSKAKRGAASAQLAALVDAIGATAPRAGPQQSPGSKASAPPFGRPILIGVRAAIVAAGIAAAFFLWPHRGTETTIAVAPAEGTALSRQVANDLELALASSSSVGPSAYQVIDASDQRARDADVTVSASGTSASGRDEYPSFIAQIVQTLAQFDRKDDVLAILLNYKGDSYDAGLAAEVLFRPAMRDVWRDPRSMAAAAHLGILHYWKLTGNWPDFWGDPKLPYDCRKEAAKYPV